jgi:hypothetical protein
MKPETHITCSTATANKTNTETHTKIKYDRLGITPNSDSGQKLHK